MSANLKVTQQNGEYKMSDTANQIIDQLVIDLSAELARLYPKHQFTLDAFLMQIPTSSLDDDMTTDHAIAGELPAIACAAIVRLKALGWSEDKLSSAILNVIERAVCTGEMEATTTAPGGEYYYEELQRRVFPMGLKIVPRESGFAVLTFSDGELFVGDLEHVGKFITERAQRLAGMFPKNKTAAEVIEHAEAEWVLP
jgi:hypothetical protein